MPWWINGAWHVPWRINGAWHVPWRINGAQLLYIRCARTWHVLTVQALCSHYRVQLLCNRNTCPCACSYACLSTCLHTCLYNVYTHVFPHVYTHVYTLVYTQVNSTLRVLAAQFFSKGCNTLSHQYSLGKCEMYAALSSLFCQRRAEAVDESLLRRFYYALKLGLESHDFNLYSTIITCTSEFFGLRLSHNSSLAAVFLAAISEFMTHQTEQRRTMAAQTRQESYQHHVSVAPPHHAAGANHGPPAHRPVACHGTSMSVAEYHSSVGP